MRQSYFRLRHVYEWRSKRRSAPAPQHAQVSQLHAALAAAGVANGSLVMAHTSVTGVTLTDADGNATPNSTAAAILVLDALTTMVGASGTLALPTHPFYRNDPGYHFHDDKRDLVLRYDPARTLTRIGLVNELFRQANGTRRSRHPLQSVSVAGPLADELLDGNLYDGALPHGANSSYERIAQRDGLVVSVGTPLVQSLTIVHIGEDLRDAAWPVAAFFRLRRFVVADGSHEHEWTVRERRPLFARAYAEGQLHRDLLAEGILHEGHADSLRVDWLRSGELLDYLMFRNEKSPYPYYLSNLAKLG